MEPAVTLVATSQCSAALAGRPMLLVPVTVTTTAAPLPSTSRPSILQRTKTATPPATRKLPLLAPKPPPPPAQPDIEIIDVEVDMRSLQSNMSRNREALRLKLAQRPESTQLVQKGILLADGNTSRISQRRELLRRRIEERPSRQNLVTQRILLSAANVEPLVQIRGHQLKRRKLADNLNRKLQQRPGPLELVTKKILQADADLEQAIHDGRVAFKPTSHPSIPYREQTPIRRTPLSRHSPEADMEVISSTVAYSNDDSSHSTESAYANSREITSSGSLKVKNTKKKSQQYRTSTPYDGSQSTVSSSSKSKSRSPDASVSEFANAPTEPSSPSDPSSVEMTSEHNCESTDSTYDLMVQQQNLYLQWQDGSVQMTQCPDGNQQGEGAESDEVDMANAATPRMLTDCFMVDPASNECHSHKMSLCRGPEPSPANSDNSPTSTTGEIDKPRSKLADLKVSDLKNECKKRQLPVSGLKPQLLERLKQYEDEILASLPKQVIADAEPSQTNGSIDISIIDAVASATLPASSGKSSAHSSSSSSECTIVNEVVCTNHMQPVRDVIHEYLQQHQPHPLRTMQPQQITFVQNAAHGSQPQPHIIQLVDAKGSVVGTATVANAHVSQPVSTCTTGCCGCSQQAPPPKEPQRFASTCYTPTECAPAPRARSFATKESTLLSHSGSATQLCQPESSKQPRGEPTFSFAQLGSGGQFTLSQSTSCLSDTRNCVGCADSSCQLSTTSQPIPCINPIPVQQSATMPNIFRPPHSQPPPKLSAPPNCAACRQDGDGRHIVHQQQPPPQTAYHREATASSSSILDSCRSETVSSCGAIPVQRRHSFACTDGTHADPFGADVMHQSCDSSLSPFMGDRMTATGTPNVPSHSAMSQSVSPAVQDEPQAAVDGKSLMSAATLSMHEDMLRFQQRKIEEIQRELARSQQQLRHQQQLIMAAKRAQLRRDPETGRVQTQTEIWLRQLDIKNLNKIHIQHFLQHRLQQQQQQQSIADHHHLVTTEQKLQEELHIDQAVQDIVRLIKQDARTALLIVQLLRRYQLERNQQIRQQAAEAAANAATEEPHHEPTVCPQPMEQPQRMQQACCGTTCANICCSEAAAKSNQHVTATATAYVRCYNAAVTSAICASGGCTAECNVEPSAECSKANVHKEKNAQNGHPKTKPPAPPKKKKAASTKSIWSRDSDANVAPTKAAAKPPKGHKASAADSSSDVGEPKPPIDMDEIFRTVLEDASRALQTGEECIKVVPKKAPAGGKKKNAAGAGTASDLHSSSAHGHSCSSADASSHTITYVISQHDPSEQIMPQLNNFHLTMDPSDCCNDDFTLEGCDFDPTNQLSLAPTPPSDGRLPSASHLLTPFMPSTDHSPGVVNYFEHSGPSSACNYTFQEPDHEVAHSKNLDDIMDVLRRDQGKQSQNPESSSGDMGTDFNLGYTCEELKEWMEQTEEPNATLSFNNSFLACGSSAPMGHDMTPTRNFPLMTTVDHGIVAPASMEAPSHDGFSSNCSSTCSANANMEQSEPTQSVAGQGMNFVDGTNLYDDQNMDWDMLLDDMQSADGAIHGHSHYGTMSSGQPMDTFV